MESVYAYQSSFLTFNRVMFISFLLLVGTHQAETLRCLQCYSENEEGCVKNQKSKLCGADDDTCYSLKYAFELSGKHVVEYGFMKGCVDKDIGCKTYCQQYLDDGYKSCNSDCCQGSHCNKNGFQNLEFKIKTKRSSSRTNGNSSNRKKTTFLLFLNCICLILSFIII